MNSANSVHSGSIRRSVIAGTWYPGARRSLTRTVDEFLDRVDQPTVPGQLVALISPHAGYAYSGQTAAYAYHQLQDLAIDTVVLLGPSHRAWVGDYAVSAEDGYETPLGIVPLDRDFIAGLAARISLQTVQGDGEHSLEIQLPFLQRQLGAFALVPIMMNADDPAAGASLAQALAETIQDRSPQHGRILLVASSDLHHIDDYDAVVRRDQPVVDAVAAYDLDALTPLLMAPTSSVCGRLPILTVLHAARALGADTARVLDYTTSGDVSGRRQAGQYTVGYLAAAIYKAQ